MVIVLNCGVINILIDEVFRIRMAPFQFGPPDLGRKKSAKIVENFHTKKSAKITTIIFKK